MTAQYTRLHAVIFDYLTTFFFALDNKYIIKFIYSDKATKFGEISLLVVTLLSLVKTNLCGLLKKSQIYRIRVVSKNRDFNHYFVHLFQKIGRN